MDAAIVCGLLMSLLICVLLVDDLRTNLRLLRRVRQSRALVADTRPDDGPAKIGGAASGSTLSAPLSGRPCVLWHVEVDESRSVLTQGRRKLLYRQTSGEHITVSSGALLAHVHVTDHKLFLSDDLRASQSRFTPLSAALRTRLHQLGVPTEGALRLGRQLHVVERLIAPGEQVFVQGEVEQIGGVPHLLGSPTAPLILTDQSEQQLLERLRRGVVVLAGTVVALLLFALLLALLLIS
ncbi:MAG TPA: GIDE domain-containing protein [Roseiflexaceae bacterium]|nr:GIDE domain-containing protein [Roseiflexaceae bacterium]